MERILKPFQDVTKRLEGHGVEGHHGCVWEALPAVELLIKHLDEMKKIYTQASHPELATSLNLAWAKLDKYYIKLDDSPAYAAAVMLHPSYRLRYFEESWKSSLAKYLGPMKKRLRRLFDDEYRPAAAEEDEQPEKDILDSYMDTLLPGKLTDQYDEYAKGNRLRNKPENVFKWWDSQTDYPDLRQMAFDYLSIPAMSSECERVFSGTKHTISDTRCRLGADIIEAIECEGRWIRAGIGDTVGPLFRYMTEQGLREEALWGPEGRPQDVEDL
jgi:hypothetical protein